jgi:Fic family protein
MNLCQWSPLTKPWLFLSPFFERHKDEYIDRLFAVSARGDWSGWVEFCLRGTATVTDETVARVEALRQLHQQLHERVRTAGGSVRLSAIIDRLFMSPLIQASEVVALTHVTPPTARSDIQRLIRCAVLKELGGQRPVTYVSPAIFDACYLTSG